MKHLLLILLSGIMLLMTACGEDKTSEWKEQYDLGVDFLNEENYDDAVIAFKEAIEIDPEKPNAYIRLADVYIAMDDEDMAVEILKNGLENFPDNQNILDKLEEIHSKAEAASLTAATTTIIETTEAQVTETQTTEAQATETQATETAPVAETTTAKPEPTKEYIIIKGKQYSTSLTELTLCAMKLTDEDIRELSEMKNLTKLNLRSNDITDITTLAELTNLTELWLDSNNITDISPLAELTNLKQLYLDYNNISDISSLAELTNLKRLYLNNNNISDISPLAGLANLGLLNLTSNNIADISPLASLKSLKSLYLLHNNISDISPLLELKNLAELYLYDNLISEASKKALGKALPDCLIEF